MAGVCCADNTNAECGMRNAECKCEGRKASHLSLQFRIPHSAFRTLHRMKFPDRLPIPPEVLKIAQQLEKAGYETWCVGGAIRDNLLGLENHDFDLTTAAPQRRCAGSSNALSPWASSTAPSRCWMRTTARTRSPRFGGTSRRTGGTPWWSSACR